MASLQQSLEVTCRPGHLKPRLIPLDAVSGSQFAIANADTAARSGLQTVERPINLELLDAVRASRALLEEFGVTSLASLAGLFVVPDPLIDLGGGLRLQVHRAAPCSSYTRNLTHNGGAHSRRKKRQEAICREMLA